MKTCEESSLTFTEGSRSLLCRRQVLKNVRGCYQTMTRSKTMSEQTKYVYELQIRKCVKDDRKFHDREHIRNRPKTTSGVTLNGKPGECCELLQSQSSLLPTFCLSNRFYLRTHTRSSRNFTNAAWARMHWTRDLKPPILHDDSYLHLWRHLLTN